MVGGLVVEVGELGVAVRMVRPSTVLTLACRLNPSALSNFATVGGETLCPAADMASANRRTDFVVHRSGDSG